MIKKKAAFSEYRDLEQSYMQLNHCLKKFHQIRAKVSQQLAESAESPKKSRETESILHNLFPQGVAGVNQEAEKDLKKIVSLFKQLEVRLKQLNAQAPVEIPSGKQKVSIMSSGNILWGSQNPIVFKNSFGVSNTDTGGQDDLSQQNPFAEGYGVLLILLMVIQAIANDKFIEVQKNAERARNTQEKSNEMDEVIAKAAKGDAKTKEEVPDDVIKYMRDHGILIDGMTIDDYMAKYGDHGKLDKGGLQAIKAALDNDANRNTDLMSQGQITIQKMSQELNAVLTQLTGLISKWGEISSMIAQKTYS